MNIIKYKTRTLIIAPSLTGLISHYKYGTLYNIYTITNNYNHTSHRYIIYIYKYVVGQLVKPWITGKYPISYIYLKIIKAINS